MFDFKWMIPVACPSNRIVWIWIDS